jgi:hypothetical protein
MKRVKVVKGTLYADQQVVQFGCECNLADEQVESLLELGVVELVEAEKPEVEKEELKKEAPKPKTKRVTVKKSKVVKKED